MYNNNIVNFQETTTILNAGKKKSGNQLKAPRTMNVIPKYLGSKNQLIFYVYALRLMDDMPQGHF